MDPIRDRPQGPARPPYSHWMFYAKWFLQFRKAPASALIKYVLYKRREDVLIRTRFHRFWTMKGARDCSRFTFFLRSKASRAHRPYAGKLRLPPARWI